MMIFSLLLNASIQSKHRLTTKTFCPLKNKAFSTASVTFGHKVNQRKKSKKDSIAEIFAVFSNTKTVSNPTLAEAELNRIIDNIEDKNSHKPWNPPYTTANRNKPNHRIYQIWHQSKFPVNGVYPGVSLLLTGNHLIFTGRNGAVEVQEKNKNKGWELRPAWECQDKVIFQKPGADRPPQILKINGQSITLPGVKNPGVWNDWLNMIGSNANGNTLASPISIETNRNTLKFVNNNTQSNLPLNHPHSKKPTKYFLA